MKKLNLKLVVILSVSFAIFTLITFFVHRFQVTRSSATLIARADQAREAKDFEEAAHLRRRYLAHNEENTSQLCELALDMKSEFDAADRETLGIKQIGRAYGMLEQAIRAEEHNEKVREAAIDFAFTIRRYPDAVEHIEYLIDKRGIEKTADLQVKLAEATFQTGDYPKAATILEELIGFDPASESFDTDFARAPSEAKAYFDLAQLYRDQLFENEQADNVIEQMVAVNPDSFKAYQLRANYRTRYSDEESDTALADRDIQKAVELAPDDEEVLLAAADIAIRNSGYELARNYLEKGVATYPENEMFYMKMVNLEAAQDDLNAAMVEVKRGLKAVPESRQLIWRRAFLEIQQNDVVAVRRSAERLREVGILKEWTDYLEVRAQLLEEKWAVASRRLEKLRPTLVAMRPSAAIEITMQLAICYERLAQYDEARRAYRQALQEQPEMLQAMLGEARSMLKLGQLSEAIAQFQQIEEQIESKDERPNPELQIMLLQLLVAEQRRLQEHERSWTDVDARLNALIKSEEIPLERKAVLGVDVRVARGDNAGAARLLKQALEKLPDSRVLQSLELNQMLRGQLFDDALVMIESMREKYEDTVSLRISRANALIANGGDDVRDSLQELLEDVDEYSELEKMQLWSGLGDAYLRLGEIDRTRELWQRVADQDKEDYAIRLRILSLAQNLGETSSLKEIVDDIERIRGKDSSEWQLAEASRLLWMIRNEHLGMESVDDVRALTDRLREQRPDWHRLARLDCEVYLLQNDFDLAIDKLERALELGPDNASDIRMLVQLLAQRNRSDEVEKWIKRMDASQLLIRERMWMAEFGSDEEMDVAAIDRIVPADSNNSEGLRWRGQILARIDENDLAGKSFRTAVELESNNPDTWVALVRFLLTSDQRDEAEMEMRNAQVQLPEKFVPMTLARCYELSGSIQTPSRDSRLQSLRQAEQFYKQALQNDPENSFVRRSLANFYIQYGFDVTAFDKANEQLDWILRDATPNADSIPNDVAWARRQRATLMAGSGSYQDYLEAIALLHCNIPNEQRLGSADLELYAMLALSRPDSLSRDQAINEFENIRESRKLSSSERLLLAQLYERTNQWDRCQDMMLTLLANFPNNENILGGYVEMLMRHDQVDEAMRRLRDFDIESPLRRRVMATVYYEQDKPQLAVQELMKMLPNPVPPESNAEIRTVAILMENIGLHDGAEILLREYVRREPRHILMLAAQLGRREGLDKLEEAFSLCDRATQTHRLEAVTQVGVDTLRHHLSALEEAEREDEFFLRVDEWFEKGLQASPDSKALYLQLAELRGLQRRTDEVVAAHRTYLNLPNLELRQKAIVQNNLAYVLAGTGFGDEALEMISNSIEHLGPTADLLDTRAMAHLARGDSINAIRDLRGALAGGDTAMKLFHLAQAELAAHNEAAAAKAFQQAIDLDLSEAVMAEFEYSRFQELQKILGPGQKLEL